MSDTVLVVDDDVDNRSIAKKVLEVTGYHVVVATNGLEALQMSEEHQPQLVLLDMSMPKMNGWEVARRLRQDPRFDRTPILAFTAHALSGEDAKAKEAGCDDYIAKPCEPRLIASKVKHWLVSGRRAA